MGKQCYLHSDHVYGFVQLPNASCLVTAHKSPHPTWPILVASLRCLHLSKAHGEILAAFVHAVAHVGGQTSEAQVGGIPLNLQGTIQDTIQIPKWQNHFQKKVVPGYVFKRRNCQGS